MSDTGTKGLLKRRGLVAGMAALVGMAAAKLSAPAPAQAAVGPILTDSSNTAGTTTSLTLSTGEDAFVVNSTGIALRGYSPVSGPAIQGFSSVLGVAGVATGTGTGIRGEAQAGFGLSGVATTGIGLSGSTSTNVGVFGSADVVGATGAIGLVGRSGSGTGVVGQGAIAGRFDGPVNISGDLAVTGMKSAAIKFPDGTHRRMYCQEAPEPWFEDFGEANLSGGRAQVAIEQGFGFTVDLTQPYHVFLSPNSAAVSGLACISRQPLGFEVQGVGDGPFSYRIVGKRRDLKNGRLEPVNSPEGALDRQIKLPDVPRADPNQRTRSTR